MLDSLWFGMLILTDHPHCSQVIYDEGTSAAEAYKRMDGGSIGGQSINGQQRGLRRQVSFFLYCDPSFSRFSHPKLQGLVHEVLD